jgi:hypothetical protein
MTTTWKARLYGFSIAGMIFVSSIVIAGLLSPFWTKAPMLSYIFAVIIGIVGTISYRRRTLRQPAIGAIAFLVCLIIPVAILFMTLMITGDIM